MNLTYFHHGDIVWLDFQPTKGHEQTGRRPALIVSATLFNTVSGLIIVCPITSTLRNYPTRVNLPNGLPISGQCECEQIRCVDPLYRNAQLICHAPIPFMENVSAILSSLVGEGALDNTN